MDLYGAPLPAGALVRLGTTRFRHDGRLLAVAYVADGKDLVPPSDDQTVRRWDAATGKELQRFPAPGFVALSAEHVVQSVNPETEVEEERTVRLWNTVTIVSAGRDPGL